MALNRRDFLGSLLGAVGVAKVLGEVTDEPKPPMLTSRTLVSSKIGSIYTLCHSTASCCTVCAYGVPHFESRSRIWS